MYNTIIDIILLYDTESRTINKANEKKMLATEMDYRRRAA